MFYVNLFEHAEPFPEIDTLMIVSFAKLCIQFLPIGKRVHCH